MEGGYDCPVASVGLCTDSSVIVMNDTVAGQQQIRVTDCLLTDG